MITQETINRGGSKLEITRAIIEQGLDTPVPVSAWKYYGNDLAPLITSFQKMRKPVIVRGSHPNDYHGFIDVVPTLRDVNTASELERAVRIIEDEVKSEDVKVHCKDWQQPFSPEVHILIQEQSPSPINGSMLRHPHKPAGYFLQYRNIEDNGPSRFPCSYAMKNLDMGEFYANGWDTRPEEEIKRALEMFQKLESSGILEKDWAYQIEFGLNPLLFFQARPFKRLQPAQDFEIPDTFKQLSIFSHYVFGITPKEGIELDCLVHSPDDLQYPFKAKEVSNQREAFNGRVGLIQIEKFEHLRSSPITLRLGNLSFFRSPCSGYDFLFHANYRFMKKADISFVDADVTSLEYPACKYYQFGDFKRARVISNGNSGVVIPVK